MALSPTACARRTRPARDPGGREGTKPLSLFRDPSRAPPCNFYGERAANITNLLDVIDFSVEYIRALLVSYDGAQWAGRTPHH
jgi:hypothetical protein